MVVVIDDQDRRLLERRIPNELSATLSALAPFRQDLLAVAVESTYNWYWLVDGLRSPTKWVSGLGSPASKTCRSSSAS
jgi:hypothetical protein